MQDNLARQPDSPGCFLLEDEGVPAGAKCHAGESRWKEISYQDFGAKEAAGIFDHVAQKRRRSCPVDLAVSHRADGRCGLWTAIRSSKLHVAQVQGTSEE